MSQSYCPVLGRDGSLSKNPVCHSLVCHSNYSGLVWRNNDSTASRVDKTQKTRQTNSVHHAHVYVQEETRCATFGVDCSQARRRCADAHVDVGAAAIAAKVMEATAMAEAEAKAEAD